MNSQIVDKYAKEVMQFVSRTVRCREDAEELVQDIFVRALRSWDRYDSRRASERTWLQRIAVLVGLTIALWARPKTSIYQDTFASVEEASAALGDDYDDKTIIL